MADNASDENGISSSGQTAGNGLSDLERLIDEKLNKALGPRLSRISDKLDETIKKQFESFNQLKNESNQNQKESNVDASSQSSERMTMKTLEQRIAQLQNEVKAQAEAREIAEKKATETRMRSELQGYFAKYLGGENPNIGPLMDSYLDVKKRFVCKDGQTFVKFQRNGYEEEKSLDEGFQELLSTEFKPFLPAKGGNLPPKNLSKQTNAWAPVSQQSPNQQQILNPMEQEWLEGLAKDRPDLANQLYAQAHAARTQNK